MRRFFIPLLILFVICDIALLFYYLKYSHSQPLIQLPLTAITSDKILTSLSPSRVYILGHGETRLLPGNPKTGSFDEILLSGVIEKEVFFDENTKDALITVSFTTKNNGHILTDFVLGQEKDKIVTAYAKNGVVDKLTWGSHEIPKIVLLLKKGDPIFIEVYFQKISADFYNNPPFACDPSCKQLLNGMNKYYENNSRLVKILAGKINIENGLKIGPVAQMIIYVPDK